MNAPYSCCWPRSRPSAHGRRRRAAWSRPSARTRRRCCSDPRWSRTCRHYCPGSPKSSHAWRDGRRRHRNCRPAADERHRRPGQQRGISHSHGISPSGPCPEPDAGAGPPRPLLLSLAASFMFLRICEGDGCYGWLQVTPAGWEACKQPVPQAHSLYSISQYHTNHPDYTHDYLSAYDSAPIGSNRIHHFPRFAALLVLRVRGLLARSRCRGCMRVDVRACSLAAPD